MSIFGKNSLIYKIWRFIRGVFKAISIMLGIFVYLIYLCYLIYAIIAGVGTLWINIALAVITLTFIIVYLALRLSRKRRKRQIKHLKQYYKILKLVAKIATALTAVYALFTAIKTSTVHPIFIFFALFGVVFLLLRLLIGILMHLLGRAVDKVKDGVTGKIKKQFTKSKDEDDELFDDEPERRERVTAKSSSRDTTNDIVIPLDECLLSDAEDEN